MFYGNFKFIDVENVAFLPHPYDGTAKMPQVKEMATRNKHFVFMNMLLY